MLPEGQTVSTLAVILCRHEALSYGNVVAHDEIFVFGFSHCTDGPWVANFPATSRES